MEPNQVNAVSKRPVQSHEFAFDKIKSTSIEQQAAAVSEIREPTPHSLDYGASIQNLNFEKTAKKSIQYFDSYRQY